jgi:hypothetical protein
VRGDGSDKLAEKVLHLASCMLEDQVRFRSRCSLRVYRGIVRFVGGVVSHNSKSNRGKPESALPAPSAPAEVHMMI